MMDFTFTRQNRAPRTVGVLICVYAALLALVILFDAAWWLVGLLSLATLPALWDIAQNTSAGLSLDPDKLRWFTGTRDAEVDCSDIDYIRFDTRWDFSVRVSLVLVSGKRIRLPDESTPHHREFEQVLQQAGFRVERHHFTAF
ncbi:hypothetical protein [Ruegeria sp. Ofav3-42]|uniref:hypothetical protein n=1 Tax=Ruegeria sp. Ofav3-42 TaxID=2917759 RepID=UPI001EF564A6|nr:hypothetical protein [Ruegeria sp. Ofav3-42]MCG7519157.1 hypothetical protein [Ruegeria sp. Ofav3-42]